MRKAVQRLLELSNDESGSSAVEYVVIASVLGLALIPVLANTSDAVQGLFNRVGGYFSIF